VLASPGFSVLAAAQSMSTSPTGIRVQEVADMSAADAEVENGRPGLSLRAYLSDSRAIVPVIAVTIFGMFLPAVIVPYAFSDDYPILAMATGFGPNPYFGKTVLDASAVNGRPFAGLLDTFLFRAAGTIDNLRFLRLFTIVGIVALALLLHWALVRSGISRTYSALIAVLVCSMPPFQVFASWALVFPSPYAALLASGASLLVVAGVDAPRNLVTDRMVAATGLLLSSLLIAQPSAMFFWIFLAVALVGSGHASKRALRLVKAHAGVAVVALALSYVVLKLGAHTVGSTAPNAARNAIVHDLVGKARWFFEQPLYRSLNLFDLTPSHWLAALVAVIASGGILLLLQQRGVPTLPYLGIAALLIPLTFLPNLVVSENFLSYRTQVSLSALIVLYVCLGALGIWFTVRDWLRPRVSGQALIVTERAALAGAIALAAGSAFSAAKNVTTLFVQPQSTELRLIRSQVAALPADVKRVGFVQLDLYQGMSPLVLGDEFGVPSSAKPWSLTPSVLLILREQGRLAPNSPYPVVDPLPSFTTTLPADEPVVDVRELQRFR
jgi:hypothetical protein